MNKPMKSSERACAVGARRGRGYCGRATKSMVEPSQATCADCLAAIRADQETKQ